MKYLDILGLKKDFYPFFDLENEVADMWKRFIPNQNFYDVLLTTFNSLNPSSAQQKRKSIWLRGTYGTGKSHATSVIKHLLWDKIENIDDFIDDLDIRYKSQIKSFREDNKVLPVIIKGASNIVDNRSFSSVIQKAVTKSLREKNIKLTTKNDFETAISFIEQNRARIDWETRIKEDDNLSIFVKDKNDLIIKLKEGDVEILQMLEKSSTEAGYSLHILNITDWLKEVINELRKKEIADFLMIYWDEFTSILELEQKGVSTSEWQSIAELSKSSNVYLFLISHRFPKHFSDEDAEKVMDRFNPIEYKMEPLTTYHIMDGAIKKKDKQTWDDLKIRHIESDVNFMSVIKYLSDNEGTSIINKIIDLFPIHPYSSYLLTFISRYVGSAQRTVFEFLYDEENGFKDFISTEPEKNNESFLTPNRLWDFFVIDFQDEQKGMVGPIFERYKSNISKIDEKGAEYSKVFKGILLLNVLKQEINIQEQTSGKVQPSSENIKKMFYGSINGNDIDKILEYFNDNNIIQKNPFGVYEISGSTVDQKKVSLEIEQLRKNFDLLKIFDRYQRNKLQDIFIRDVLRHNEIKIYNADIDENKIVNILHKENGEPKFSINISLFISQNDANINRANKILRDLSSQDDFKNNFFVLVDEPLNETELEKYLQYKARANIAGKYDQFEEKRANEELADKIVENWIERIRKQYVTWCFRGDSRKNLSRELSDYINNQISPILYSLGLENTPARQPATIWEYSKSEKSIETTLNSPNRDALCQTKGKFNQLQNILLDHKSEWIVDSNLELKKDVDKSHPIVRAANLVTQKINDAPPHRFHLGETLSSLSKPPYGYYKNPVNFAAMGFIMRKYVDCLYECGSGHPIDKPQMKNKILDIFEFWESGKEKGDSLEIRLSSREEIELIDKMKTIFKIDEKVKGLNEVKWKIRDLMKEEGFPIWIYKEFTDNSTIKDTIQKIHDFIKSIDFEIDEKTINVLLKEIELNQFELLAIFNEKNLSKEGFIKWINNIKGFEFEGDLREENVLKGLMEFIRSDLQEEEPSWDQAKVENSIWRWKTKNDQQSEDSQTSKDGELNINDGNSSPLTNEEVQTFQTSLDDFPGDELKIIILKVVEDYPAVGRILQKYLNGNNELEDT